MASLPGAVLYRDPAGSYPVATRAGGMYIEDAKGRRYLDMSGGAAVSCLGHGNRRVIEAIVRQLDALPFAHTAFFTNPPQEALAEQLADRFAEPGARVYFLSGGSEANETALKMAWQYWAARGEPARKIVISREHSYHGNTFGALSVSGNALRRRASRAPLLDWPRIEPCYAYRDRRPDESAAAYAMRAANALESAILECGAGNVAAFICEPIVGSSLGVVPAEPGYLARIRAICDRYDVLLIMDEIMAGCGRTGTYFAHEHDSIVPDLVTLAKGIAGGYQPLAAVIARAPVAECLSASGFAHGHTYIGHATACAAGLAVLDVIEDDGLLEQTRKRGAELFREVTAAFGSHPNVGDIRGRGLFLGIELVSDRTTRAGFADKTLAERLRRAALDHGLVCYPGSIAVNGATVPHIMLAPPMIVERTHIDECVEKLAATLEASLPAH